MLSHDEDRHLRAIERWFEADDPALAQMFRDHEPPKKLHEHKAARVSVDLAGATLFVLGVVTATAAMVVFGVLVLSVGICLHLSTT